MAAPQPHRTITCQQVLKDGHCTHSGWLRKRTSMHQKMPAINKIIPWTNMYVVLSQGCMYLFSSDTANKPDHPFSLHGYDKILQAGEILQKDVPWPFKLEPVRRDDPMHKKKTRYFSAGSEREQKVWMTEIKKQMMWANGKGMKVSHSVSGDGESVSLSVVQESVYTNADDFQPSTTTHDSDSEGESYNHIEEWDMDGGETRSSYNRRPLPPPPPQDTTDSRPAASRARKQSNSGVRDADIGSRPPAPIPVPTTPTSPTPASPLSSNKPVPLPRGHRQPPPIPDEPPEDSPPATPVNRENSHPAQGNVHSKISAFNNTSNGSRPAVPKNKPKLPPGAIACMMPVNNSDLKKELKSTSSTTSATSPTSRKLPTPPEQRRPPPIPPPVRRGASVEQEELTEEDFIQSIYVSGISKEEASSLVTERAEEGVYLLRDGSGPDNDYVLVVYAENQARKYKVSKSDGQVYLVKEKRFPSLKLLIGYYHENSIPLRENTTLTRPYKS